MRWSSCIRSRWSVTWPRSSSSRSSSIASLSAGDSFSAASRAACASSTTRTSVIRARSVMLTSVTKVPRWGTERTRFSRARRCSASRIGVRPMPSSSRSLASLTTEPGGISRLTMRSRMRTYASSLCERCSTTSATAITPSLSLAICDRYTGAESSTTLALRQIGCLCHPAPKVSRAQHPERPLPAPRVVAHEVEVDCRDLRLDRAPQRPADVRHEREQVHARQLPRIPPAEVRLAQGGPQLLAELRLLRGVAQVEAGIVVAAQLVVDDAQRRPVVDEVLAEEVVVAGRHRQRGDADRALDVAHRRQPLAIV